MNAVTESVASTAAAPLSAAGGVAEMLLSLALVLAVIFALAWLLRRMQSLRGTRAGSLRIHGGLPLGQKERVIWFEAGGQHFLVGVTPGQVSLLHRFEQAPEMPEATEASPPAVLASFTEQLNKALGRQPS